MAHFEAFIMENKNDLEEYRLSRVAIFIIKSNGETVFCKLPSP